ncbi:MAG TPA: YHYH protein [Minicystis sp.]|nr:YHYH protein [Minicystis sp.]
MILSGTGRELVGNGLPNHPTGVYPIEKGTEAYTYYSALPAQGYDNAAEIPIAAYDLDITVPRDPKPNPTPSCVSSIFLGVVTQTGAAWHAEIAPDAQLKLHDPISALPLDDCWGHPYNKQYHYHAYSWKCFPNQGNKGEHSPLFGYAIDGFGVYGPRGEGGKLVTNDDLDECHGHTHVIEWDGKMVNMYHYHVNNEYPYAIGCYRGTPIKLPKQLQE